MKPVNERTEVTAQCPNGHTWETMILPGSTMPQTPSCPKCDMLVAFYPSLQRRCKRIRCNQCEAAMINGVFCHETGCPNTHSRYDVETNTWIRQRKCFECGCTVDADDICCNEEVQS